MFIFNFWNRVQEKEIVAGYSANVQLTWFEELLLSIRDWWYLKTHKDVDCPF